MPSPTPAEFADRFTQRERVIRYRDRYLSGRHARVNRREQAALRDLLSGIERLGTALDLPCGTGRFFAALAEHADRVILADSSAVMLEVAREDIASPAAQFVHTNAEAIGLESNSVDLVFCHRLLHHIHDRAMRARMFGDLARVTRRYLVTSLYPPGLRSRLGTMARRLLGRSAVNLKPFTMAELETLAECHRLRLLSRRTLRRIPFAEFLLFERSDR
jgi:SAM-dependent methyltransferase